MTKERGIIVHGGMGGFLSPPTHPEHSLHIETGLNRRPADRGSMSLSYAATCEYLEDETREIAKKMLETWSKPPIDSPEIKDWIYQVLGYFGGCYADLREPEEIRWNCDKLMIDPTADPFLSSARHAGVHHIRRYYPEYEPTREDFNAAYWGRKKEASK